MKKTNVIPGACFGYFDDSFEDCRKCNLGPGCVNASRSTQVEEVRAIAKTSHAQVSRLFEEWKMKEKGEPL